MANTAQPPPPHDNREAEARPDDATRLTPLYPPLTSGPICATIRKAPGVEPGLAELAGSSDVEKIIAAALDSRRNILVAGDAPATSAVVRALAAAIPTERRIISIGTQAKARPGLTEVAPTSDAAALL